MNRYAALPSRKVRFKGKLRILVFILSLLLLSGCAVKETEQSTVANGETPTEVISGSDAEPAAETAVETATETAVETATESAMVSSLISDDPHTTPFEGITAGESKESRLSDPGASAGEGIQSGGTEAQGDPEGAGDGTGASGEVSGNEAAGGTAEAEKSGEATDAETSGETADAAASDEVSGTGASGGGTFTSEEIPDEVFARMKGVSYPDGCSVARENLRYLRLSYHDFNGQTQLGEMVCSKKIADDLTEIFKELYNRGYQIEKMRLIDDYGGDDDLSCADNNTSCFNYRTVAGSTNLSKHALGLAVDINPFYNPYVTYPGGVERISPPGSEPYADRNADFPHKIGPGDAAYELFMSHGFTWGGNWKTLKDYQHFQKAS